MRLTLIRYSSDFFGLSKVTTKTVSGISSQNKLAPEKVYSKYEPLMVARNKLMNEEKIVENNFGSVRFDCDNTVIHHGQYEPGNNKTLYDTKLIKDAFAESTNNQDLSIDGLNDTSSKSWETGDTELDEILRLFKKSESKLVPKNKPPLNFEFVEPIRKPEDVQRPENFITSSRKAEKAEKVVVTPNIEVVEKPKVMHDIPTSDEEIEKPEEYKEIEVEPDIPKIETKKKPLNALRYVRSLRSENLMQAQRVKLDSQGYHDYSNQTLDWFKMRHVDAINALKSSIIYDNYDVLAINKPYGLASHEENRKIEPFDVNSLMQEIGKQMGAEKLYLAHRLDKSTTGVLLFARTQERAKKLNKLFKADLVKKTYLCITRGVPSPDHAIIDIPIGEFVVAKKTRSCLVPEDWSADMQISPRYREARRAITEYRVINHQRWTALLEVKPRSGVKHQIRCHLGFGLSTPILGDHKYSHLTKIAPQVLPVQLLKKLHLRQQKVRTLPIHLHASSIVIPDIKPDGQTLFITAPLPYHFIQNMRQLELKYDKQ